MKAPWVAEIVIDCPPTCRLRARVVAPSGAVADQPRQRRGAGEATQNLHHHVARGPGGVDLARREEPDGHRRIDVGAGNVPVGVGEAQHHQTVRKRHADQPSDAECPRASADEDQRESADELGDQRG